MRKDIKIVYTHRKRYSTLYVIREMQNKTVTRYRYTPVRMATIWTNDNIKCEEGVDQQELTGRDAKW